MLSVLRLNFISPEADRDQWSALYREGLEMVSYADANGFAAVSLEEHHGASNGWSPTPLLTAGMALSRTKNVNVSIMALLVPLHDPLRLAEDIAVLDLAFPGRLMITAGLGYRPEEYAQHDKDWSRRGKIMDASMEAMLAAWKGEPFTYEGRTVQVTPVPVTKPHPMLCVGGTSKPSARRAARLGLPLSTAAYMPELAAYYEEQCREHGTTPFTIMPSAKLGITFVDEDPDTAWQEIGPHLLHEATTYAGWQTPDIRSGVHSHATTLDELRAEGIYRILSPEQCIEEARRLGDNDSFLLHPLCGGIPVERGWDCMRLYVEKVLPALRG